MKANKFMIVALFITLLLLSGCQNKEDIEAKGDPRYIAEGIRKLAIVKEQKEVLTITYEPSPSESSYQYWKIPVPYGQEAIVNTETMLLLYHRLESLSFENEADIREDTETGLSYSSTSIIVDYCRANQAEREAALRDEVYQGKEQPSKQAEADSQFTLNIGTQDGQGNYYAAFQAAPEKIYLLPKSIVDAILSVKPFDLILKVSATVDVATVAEVNIKMNSTKYQLIHRENSFYFGEQQVQEELYRSLYAELLSVLVVDERTNESKISDEVLLEIEFKRNQTSLADVQIVYQAYNEELALVSVNGVARLLVERAALETLMHTIEEKVGDMEN